MRVFYYATTAFSLTLVAGSLTYEYVETHVMGVYNDEFGRDEAWRGGTIMTLIPAAYASFWFSILTISLSLYSRVEAWEAWRLVALGTVPGIVLVELMALVSLGVLSPAKLGSPVARSK